MAVNLYAGLNSAIEYYESTRRYYLKNSRTGRIAGDNARFLAVHRRRARVQQYMETLRNTWTPGLATFKEGRRAKVMRYDCGCILPVGYPLYRKFEPCAAHVKTAGGMTS